MAVMININWDKLAQESLAAHEAASHCVMIVFICEEKQPHQDLIDLKGLIQSDLTRNNLP